jgi:hypothetical protein
MNRSRITRSVAFALLATSISLGMTGCSKNNPVTTGDPGSSILKPGSNFTMHGTITSQGQLMAAQDYDAVVTDANASYFGKTGLTRFVSTGGSTFMKYESNGDISAIVYASSNGVPVDSLWVAYPFGSKGSTTIPTTTTVSNGMQSTFSGTLSYVGSEQVNVANETFQTEKVRIAQRVLMGAPGQEPLIDNSRIDTVWYASRIGYFVKQSGIQTIVTGPPGSSTAQDFQNVAVLIGYKLQ